MIGLDNTMFTQEGRGDLAERLKKYAKHVDFISLVVYTPEGFKPVKIADNVMAYPTNSKRKWRFPWHAARLAAQINGENPVSLVTTQDPFVCGFAGYLAKRRLKLPLVINIFSSFFDDAYWLKENWKHRFFNMFGKWLVRRADGVRVECDTEREKVISLGVSSDKVKVAPVLVNLERFAKEKDKSVRDKYLGDADSIVLYVGRLSVEKNVGLLVKAAKLVVQKRPKTKFLIVGGGAEELELKQLASGEKNIVFTGRIPHPEIPKYHRAADLLVLPSFYEGIPLVVVEAAAAGLPVICTDVRDAKDVIIEGKSGFIVPKDNPDLLAVRILDVLSDKKAAKEMGVVGQKLVMEKFDPERNLKDCVDLWRQVSL